MAELADADEGRRQRRRRREVGAGFVPWADQAVDGPVAGDGVEAPARVVAEGVENLAQLQFLQENACDLAQGYFIFKPLAKDDLNRFLS